MAGISRWNAPVACVGLAAFVGMLFRFPVLLHMLERGEIALLKAVPIVVGALLLLIGCLGLLLRRPSRGVLFIVAAVALLVALWWLPDMMFSVWLWLGVLAVIGGAAIGVAGKPA